MQFRYTCLLVMSKQKTQTRRLRFPYDLAVQLWKHGWSLPKRFPWADEHQQALITEKRVEEANCILANNHITLCVRPGRTARSEGRIHALAIRRERLQYISCKDCKAEGFGYHIPGSVVHQNDYYAYLVTFSLKWDEINDKLGTRWTDNPKVWVLEFQKEE